MKKFILSLALVVAASTLATAQTDYNKGEFFVGYSHGQVDSGVDSGDSVNSFFRDRIGFNGFETSGVYNVSRYVGIKGDVSGTYKSTRFSFPIITGANTQTVTVDTKNSLYNFLGGVQIKDNANVGRFKPFAHALVGLGHGRTGVNSVTCTTTPNIDCTDITSVNDNGLAGAFGGGLDIRVNDKVDFRAFQVDYNPIKFENTTDHNVRFTIGIVIK
jgi:hypothetical protein